MNNFINQEKCKKCKLCIEVCPVNIIETDTNNNVNFIEEKINICLKCGQCMAVCSAKAINIKGYNYKENFDNLPENSVNYENFINFIANRRSIRNFKNKKIEKELVNKIISSLYYTPYGSQPNKVKISIINNRDIIEKTLPDIENFLDNIVKWIENPVIRYLIKRNKAKSRSNLLTN